MFPKYLGTSNPWNVNHHNLRGTSGITPSSLQQVRDLDEARVPEMELVGLSSRVIHLLFSEALFLQVVVEKEYVF